MTEDQFAVLATLLVEIRDQLVELNTAASAVEPETDECQHPNKVSLGTYRDPHHWICPDCKVESHGVTN